MAHESDAGYDKTCEATVSTAADWLRQGSELHLLLEQTVRDLAGVGWELDQWSAPSRRDIAAFQVVFVKRGDSRGSWRKMVVSMRTEWPAGGERTRGAFVDSVVMVGYPNASHIVVLPVSDPSATHVSRKDPLATAVSLGLATDEELWETYHPDALRRAAQERMDAEAADILAELGVESRVKT